MGIEEIGRQIVTTQPYSEIVIANTMTLSSQNQRVDADIVGYERFLRN